MDRPFEQVKAFHKAFGHPCRETPGLLSPQRRDSRVKWMREEVQEFVDAETVEDQADAMIDLMYFALGTLVEMGVRPGELFDIVHNANMQKLWPDGKVHCDPDGKVIKPAGWQDPAPLLRQALARQAK